MDQPIEDFAAFVRRVRTEAGLSTRQVAKAARGISHGYVSQIENRQVVGENIAPARLIALARGLGVNEERLFAVARGKPLSEIDAMQSQLLTFFGQLPFAWQEDALRIVKTLHQAHSIKPESIEKHKSKKNRVA